MRQDPYQPQDTTLVVNATRRRIGQKNEYRSFQLSWYKSFPWLSVCLSSGKAFCHACRTCTTKGFSDLAANAETAFSVDGFNNWKKAVSRFGDHMHSDAHKASLEQMNASKQQSVNIQLQQQTSDDQKENYHMLLKHLSTVKMLLRQGLALRGHTEKEGNLTQLLLLRSEDVPELKKWVSNQRYTSPDIVNEQVNMMGQMILRTLLVKMQAAGWYSILADETRDMSNLEQLTICIRWVDAQYGVHEDFIGLLQVPNTTAATLAAGIKDVLLRCNLPLAQCRGQAYDGAANMSGHRSGVATRLLEEEPAALHVHCLAHCLNLCLQDAARKFQPVRDALDLCTEVAKLILWSPKRMQAFLSSKEEFSPDGGNIRPLCPTRWTVREGAIASVLRNYAALQDTLTSVNQECHDDYGRRAGGVLAQMQKFDTYFGLKLSHLVFGATEQLSRTLQHENISLMEALTATELAQAHLKHFRTDEQFNQFYERTKITAEERTDPPCLPRYKRAPKRLDDGSKPHRYGSPEAYHRHLFFELLELVNGEISKRFDQKSMAVPRAIEKVLLDACSTSREDSSSTELPVIPTEVTELYQRDLDMKKLARQLLLLPELIAAAKKTPELGNLDSVVSLTTIADVMCTVPLAKIMFAEIDKLLRLYMTIPVTTASGERSFSTLRRIKTYLRSTMTQERLNSVMMMHAHKAEVDKLVMTDLAQVFISQNERRRRFFGKPAE